MISDQQDSNLSQAAARSKKRKQDTVNPMVININDGRLMPNTPRLRVHKDYRVFTGDINATLPDRMRWLTGAKRQPIRVVNTQEAANEFDLGSASKEDIVTFAFEEYGAVLEPTQDIRKLRKEVIRLFEASKVPEPA
jgi:hypothetical protein